VNGVPIIPAMVNNLHIVQTDKAEGEGDLQKIVW